MATEGSGLHDHLGYWLRRLSDQVHTSFERRLAAHDVTVAQWNVLVTIYHDEARTTSDVARYVSIDIAAVSRVVDRLVAKGLVVRVPDPMSRRRQVLVLTQRASTLVPILIAEADGNEEEFFGDLPATQRSSLSAQLAALMKHDAPKE